MQAQRFVVQDALDRAGQAGESLGSTSRPFLPCSTDEGMPPTRVATTGQPNARASTSVRGVPSERLGSTNTSWLRYKLEQWLAEVDQAGQRDVVAIGAVANPLVGLGLGVGGLVGAADQRELQRPRSAKRSRTRPAGCECPFPAAGSRRTAASADRPASGPARGRISRS